MENGSKALMMAASVLIAMAVIGLLVYGYSEIREANRLESAQKEVEQAAEFNKKYEAYMRDDLYGADILSVVNLIHDYNQRHGQDEDGYKDIDLKVEASIRNTLFRRTSYNENDLKTILDNYNRKKTDMLSVKYGGKTIDQFVNMRTEELDKFKSEHPEIRNLDQLINEYTTLVDDMTAFKTQHFKFINVKYDINGRIEKLTFKQS